MIALVDHWRSQVGLPWVPGGVAFRLGPVGTQPWRSRYDEDEAALGAKLRFVRMMEQIDEAVLSGQPYLDAVTRATRGGAGGYLSWTVFLDVPNDASIQALYNWYVRDGNKELFPGAGTLDPTPLPFG